jgi:hypothetical protein
MLAEPAPGLLGSRLSEFRRHEWAAAGRGRPPQATPSGPAGLEGIEKGFPSSLNSADTTEQNAGMLRVPTVESLVELAYWSMLRVVLVLIEPAPAQGQGGRDGQALAMQTLTPPLATPWRP